MGSSSTTTRTPRTGPAWSVRPTPDARVSMPLEWDEVADCDPAAFTLATAPARFAERGDPSAGLDSAVGSHDALLELSASQEAAGLGDAPWPPHYKKQRDEPPRVAPSRRKTSGPSTERHGHRESTQPLITAAKAACSSARPQALSCTCRAAESRLGDSGPSRPRPGTGRSDPNRSNGLEFRTS